VQSHRVKSRIVNSVRFGSAGVRLLPLDFSNPSPVRNKQVNISGFRNQKPALTIALCSAANSSNQFQQLLVQSLAHVAVHTNLWLEHKCRACYLVLFIPCIIILWFSYSFLSLMLRLQMALLVPPAVLATGS